MEKCGTNIGRRARNLSEPIGTENVELKMEVVNSYEALVTCNRRIEAAPSSEMSVNMSQTTRNHIPLYKSLRVNVPPKCLQTSSGLHGVTSQETVTVIVTVVITSNITLEFSSDKLILSYQIFRANTLNIFHVSAVS
jgi:hypothetical protein